MTITRTTTTTTTTTILYAVDRDESLHPYYYYYYLGDEQRIFMTKHYLKNARNFTIHQLPGHRIYT
jgi:hypothetical protein